MSIRGMVDHRVKREQWTELKNSPEKRAQVRDAARAVLEAQTDVEEYYAIVKLAKVLP